MINIDKDTASAHKYNISGIPAILFLDGTGKVVHSTGGFMPPESLVKEMNTALSKAKKK